MSSSPVTQELQHQQSLWSKLKEAGGPKSVPAALVNDLKIYYGGRGIWMEKVRTMPITGNRTGIAVGLLHTGEVYPDDLSEDGVLYHYPETRRPGTDLSEIEATKAASILKLPVFVVTASRDNSSLRDVYLGWVEGWDDKSKLFLVSFVNEPNFASVPLSASIKTEQTPEPFQLEEEIRATKRQVTGRPGQQRFKFRLLQHYGTCCSVCDIDIAALLDGAHLRPKNKNGSDDWRNGLLFCANHHRAFDAGLFAIEPNTLRLRFKLAYVDASKLQITRTSLEHLPVKPHQSAVQWAWEHWK